jgi:hypothetical protein
MPSGVYPKTPEHLEKLRAAAALRRGASNPTWKGGRIDVDSSPYVQTYAGPSRYDAEHRVVAERVLGRPLPEGAVVHHVNGNGRDNRPANLVICQDGGYHRLLHARKRVYDLGGNPNTEAWCSACKRLVELSEFLRRRRRGTTRTDRDSRCRTCKNIERNAYRSRRNAA